MRQIVNDVGMANIERAGRGVVAVSLLGDGQRYDANARVGHGGKQRVALRRRVDHVEYRADDARLRAGSAADDERVEEVLRCERLAGGRPAQRGTDDPPGGVHLQNIVDIDRDVRAAKRTDPEMHDAGGYPRAVIGEPRREIRGGERPAEDRVTQLR